MSEKQSDFPRDEETSVIRKTKQISSSKGGKDGLTREPPAACSGRLRFSASDKMRSRPFLMERSAVS